jgi:hypothetical protein
MLMAQVGHVLGEALGVVVGVPVDHHVGLGRHSCDNGHNLCVSISSHRGQRNALLLCLHEQEQFK